MRQALASRTMLDPGPEVPATPPPSPEEIADKFPQFEITECLGRGGMGVVYKARQKSLDRWVAIKILAPERVGEERFAERFAREAQTLACLSHPNIVTVFDYGETDGLYYIVMEFVDGVNLRNLLRDGNLEPQQALTIIPPICEALQYAHDKGIVHRDIKPENLLLDRDGRIKIADFGIAALVGASGEQSGTPPYMAPEQGEATSEIDHRADIYALGAVLYETLTGERPGSPLQPPSQKVQVDIRIDDIVLRALNKDPDRRYRTADEFRTMVETVAATPTAVSTPLTAPPVPPSAPPASTVALDPRWSQAAAILLIVTGAINLLSAALSLLILPVFQAVMGRITGSRFDHPTEFAEGMPRTETVEMFSMIRSASPIDAFSYGLGVFLLSCIAITITVAISILTLHGGRHMLRGTSRSWAITGAVACCLTPLWWPVGLAVGVFSIVVLFLGRSPVATTVTFDDGSGSPLPPSPKLSGMAVTGAVFQSIPVVLVLLSLGLALIVPATTGGEVGGVNGEIEMKRAPFPPFILLSFILFSVPGGILGWIAAGRIRASEGQVRGMGFAIFAAMTPVVVITSVVSFGASALLLHLIAGEPHPDKITLVLSGIVVALTALGLLILILGACFRYLRGTPAPPRQKRRRFVALTLLVLWIALGGLFFLQRPRQVDSWLSSVSDDEQYSAKASTWHRMRVFSGDHLTYRFVVQGKGGSLVMEREIPVPVNVLAKDYLVPPNKDLYFGNKGNIRWHENSVGFCIGDLSIHSIGL
jgi:serine/threonine protein kinase